jgi:hypothetical protein
MAKSFAERYPNFRHETRNQKITNMIPAVGWWKAIFCLDSKDVCYEPVAFFATVEWEQRGVWDGGRGDWTNDSVVYANTGTGDEWFLEFMDQISGGSSFESRLFYSPDFTITKEQQGVDEDWFSEMKELNKKRIERAYG